MSSKFIIRIDDVHPEMNHNKFNSLISLLNKFSINPILGVIPNNKDNSLVYSKEENNFWHKILCLQKKGALIAQHGYQHVYDTTNGGILNFNVQSEFAGHSLEIQRKRMKKGKLILEERGLTPKLFMAPSHSFDSITLQVIKEFNYGLTDGFGLWPEIKDGVLWIPQLFASPKSLGWGLYTICLHSDKMNDKAFNQLEMHIKKYSKSYIDLQDIDHYLLHKHQYGRRLLNFLLTFIIKRVLYIKRKI